MPHRHPTSTVTTPGTTAVPARGRSRLRRSAAGSAVLTAAVSLALATGSAGAASASTVAGPAAVPATPALAAPAVPATSVSNPGLYGVQDPTYDGVLRQGYALVALRTAGRGVPASAVRWLLTQQCADGSFASFRAAPAAACTARTPNARDTNATAAAVLGLGAVGTTATRAAATRAVRWLERIQNRDGGVGFAFGAATDTNSTGLFVEALQASGIDPRSVHSRTGRTPLQALTALQVGCTGAFADRGALDYQTESPLLPNSLATTGALLGLTGGTLPVAPRSRTAAVPRLRCGVAQAPRTRAVAAAAAAGWTARTLAAHAGVVIGFDGRSPDVGQTVGAVLGLVHQGVASRQVAQAVSRLDHGLLLAWVTTGGHNRPAAAAEAIVLAHALGVKPTAFGGVDYVKRLVASGPRS